MNSFLLLGSIDSITLKSITNGIIELFLIKIISRVRDFDKNPKKAGFSLFEV
jgi:hypothetical protein